MNQTIIENLSHTFIGSRHSTKAIEYFSLTINESETVSVLGPSGCGKSTILKCVAGLLKPTLGNITVNGKKPSDALKEKDIGFAFQEAALLEWATVTENILLPGNIGRLTISKPDLNKKVGELIDLMNLTSYEKFYPSQLSGGMKQRVALARALLLQPSLLLLDEPFGSLDLLTRSNLIVEFNRILAVMKIPCLIVTHSIEEAVFLADKVIILSPRPCKIIAEIKPELGNSKSFEMFDDTAFTSTVAECRNILLKSWSKNGKQKSY